MKKKIIIVILGILLIFTGCTKRVTLTNDEGKPGKSYVSNILCKPTDQKTIDIYEKNEEKIKVNLEKLPECKEYKINSGGYEGLWTSIFVKPLAWAIIKIGLFVKNYGLAIMIAALILRAILFPFSKKSTMLSENMKKAKPELDRLEKKYENKTDKQATMMKSQEMMAIYKKYNISPLSGCLFAFLQLPIFFAFLEAIYRVPVLFEGKFLVFNLGTTPWEGIKSGNYFYIILILLIIATTYFSMKNASASIDDAQAKQMKTMNNFMIIFISFASFSLPTAIALYWIVSSGFTVIQNILLKKLNSKEPKLKKAKVKNK